MEDRAGRGRQPEPHKSVVLGVKSLTLGLLGSLIAYIGLWTEFRILGFFGFIMVAIAVVGAIISLIWNAVVTLRGVRE